MAANDPSNTDSHGERPSRASAVRWRTPLLWAAGADDVLITNPVQRAWVGSQGALLILIGIISAFSALSMMSLIGVKSLAVAILASIVWGSLVFVATRMTIQTHTVDDEPPSRRRTVRRILGMTPVAMLMVLSAILVSQLVMLSIAEREIDVRLAETKSGEIAEIAQSVPQTSPFAEKFRDVARVLQAAVENTDKAGAAEEQARLALEKEATGIAGTGLPGDGPETQRFREQYAQATVRVQQTQTDLLAAQERASADRAALIRAVDTEVSERAAMIENNDGLVARSEALDAFAADSPSLALIRWCLTIAFILVFLAPMLLSLGNPRHRQVTSLPAMA